MKQKTLPFIALIVAIFCLWPQYKSPGQAPDHPTPAALDAKAQQIEKKIINSKAAIFSEIDRINNLPAKVVTKNSIRTVYKYVPKVIFIDTCLTQMGRDTFFNIEQSDTIPSNQKPKKQNIFQSLFKKIFHPKKRTE